MDKFIFFVRLIIFGILLGLTRRGSCDTVVEAESSEESSQSLLPATSVNPPKPLVGHTANLSCIDPNNKPLKECRWERKFDLNDHYLINVTQGEIISNTIEFGCNCSYKQIGRGLDRGDCSISIINVSKFHAASWECVLIYTDEIDPWIGKLNIDVSASFSSPNLEENATEIIVELRNATPSLKQNVKCCVDGGDPSFHLQIDIGLNMGDKLKQKNDVYMQSEGRVCEEVEHIFVAENNGQKMFCNASYTYNEERYELTHSIPVQVNFGPRFPPVPIWTEKVNNDSDLLVNVTFIAQPQPNVIWTHLAIGQHENLFPIRQDHIKYRTKLYHDKDDLYIATLIITDMQEEDYNRTFTLSLSNQFGISERNIILNDLTTTSLQIDEVWQYLYLLIGLAAAVVLVVLAIIICSAVRNRQRQRATYSPPNVAYATSAADDNDS